MPLQHSSLLLLALLLVSLALISLGAKERSIVDQNRPGAPSNAKSFAQDDYGFGFKILTPEEFTPEIKALVDSQSKKPLDEFGLGGTQIWKNCGLDQKNRMERKNRTDFLFFHVKRPANSFILQQAVSTQTSILLT